MGRNNFFPRVQQSPFTIETFVKETKGLQETEAENEV